MSFRQVVNKPECNLLRIRMDALALDRAATPAVCQGVNVDRQFMFVRCEYEVRTLLGKPDEQSGTGLADCHVAEPIPAADPHPDEELLEDWTTAHGQQAGEPSSCVFQGCFAQGRQGLGELFVHGTAERRIGHAGSVQRGRPPSHLAATIHSIEENASPDDSAA